MYGVTNEKTNKAKNNAEAFKQCKVCSHPGLLPNQMCKNCLTLAHEEKFGGGGAGYCSETSITTVMRTLGGGNAQENTIHVSVNVSPIPANQNTDLEHELQFDDPNSPSSHEGIIAGRGDNSGSVSSFDRYVEHEKEPSSTAVSMMMQDINYHLNCLQDIQSNLKHKLKNESKAHPQQPYGVEALCQSNIEQEIKNFKKSIEKRKLFDGKNKNQNKNKNKNKNFGVDLSNIPANQVSKRGHPMNMVQLTRKKAVGESKSKNRNMSSFPIQLPHSNTKFCMMSEVEDDEKFAREEGKGKKRRVRSLKRIPVRSVSHEEEEVPGRTYSVSASVNSAREEHLLLSPTSVPSYHQRRKTSFAVEMYDESSVSTPNSTVTRMSSNRTNNVYEFNQDLIDETHLDHSNASFQEKTQHAPDTINVPTGDEKVEHKAKEKGEGGCKSSETPTIPATPNNSPAKDNKPKIKPNNTPNVGNVASVPTGNESPHTFSRAAQLVAAVLASASTGGSSFGGTVGNEEKEMAVSASALSVWNRNTATATAMAKNATYVGGSESQPLNHFNIVKTNVLNFQFDSSALTKLDGGQLNDLLLYLNKLQKYCSDVSSSVVHFKMQKSACIKCQGWVVKKVLLLPCQHCGMCEKCGQDVKTVYCPKCNCKISKRITID